MPRTTAGAAIARDKAWKWWSYDKNEAGPIHSALCVYDG